MLNRDEFIFYIRSLNNHGYIDLDVTHDSVKFVLTYQGSNFANQLQEEGELSNKCFIAMSFDDSTIDIRKAIKEACFSTKYVPIIIDEIPIDSEQTINDSIIANLKKCKFCIADFTNQRAGVYFESGYALGQGKKVIYSCSKDWFDKSHFDTNHFPHVIYTSTEDLKSQLINRIEAWI